LAQALGLNLDLRRRRQFWDPAPEVVMVTSGAVGQFVRVPYKKHVWQQQKCMTKSKFGILHR
jgi:hypothetical protein